MHARERYHAIAKKKNEIRDLWMLRYGDLISPFSITRLLLVEVDDKDVSANHGCEW